MTTASQTRRFTAFAGARFYGVRYLPYAKTVGVVCPVARV